MLLSEPEPPMTLPCVLIDFENVQPKALTRLVPGTTRIKVFLGQHQSKIMLELVKALQPFGSDAEYIQIQGSGPDAVDFHIAFYIGQLAAAEPKTTFTIVSKDRGFDPLIRHLALRGIECRRTPELPALGVAATVLPKQAAPAAAPKVKASKQPVPVKPSPPVATTKVTAKKAAAPTARARAKAVAERLKKASKPATLAGLRSSIKSWFNPAPDDKTIDAVLQSLQDSKKLSIVGEKVSYSLG